MSLAPEFTIVTPSYNMLGYLQRCVRSVADQQGATFEHLVIDGGSSDGTAEWLREREADLDPSQALPPLAAAT